jgi:TIR domain
MSFDVFISYPHQDKATADAACAALEADGIRCWIAPRDVSPGTEWAAAVVDAIDRCRVMVLIFSSSANESKQIYREVQRAFDHEKPVVPLRVENVTPTQSLAYFMGPVHWLDALTPPLEAHLKTLGVAVRAFLQVREPDDQRTIDRPKEQEFSKDRQRPREQQPIPAPRRRYIWLLAAAGAGILAVAVGVTWLVSSAKVPIEPQTPSVSRQAAAIEGAFGGTMECDKLPWTMAPLNVAISLSIKPGEAVFSRDVYSGDGKRKIGIETGTGVLDADGVVQLNTSWVSRTARFDGRYIGRLSASGGILTGKQVLLVNGARHERACTITLKKIGSE